VEPEKEDEEEDVMWISENDVNVDMSDWLYEFIHLSVPLRKVHPDLTDGNPGCDPKVISKLKAEQSKPESDPRWDKLKSLDKE
jgi:uncharacterized metal-binding protein YceD (DUF177 family)